MTKIGAPSYVLRTDFLFNLSNLRSNLVRPDMRNGIVIESDFNFQPGIQVVPKDLDDFTHRLIAHRRLPRNPDQYDLARLRVGSRLGFYQYVLTDSGIIGAHQMHAAFTEVAAHQLLGTVLDNLHQPAFRSPAPVVAGDPNQHLITIEHLAHLPTGEKNIVARLGGYNKTKTFGMSGDSAFNHFHVLESAVGPAAVSHHLAVALHRRQSSRQRFPLNVAA